MKCCHCCCQRASLALLVALPVRGLPSGCAQGHPVACESCTPGPGMQQEVQGALLTSVLAAASRKSTSMGLKNAP